MHPTTAALRQLLTQQIGAPTLVINIANQRVLNRDTTTGRAVVVVGGIQSLVDLPPLVNRNQFVAQFIIRCMQGQSQSDG